MKRNLLTGLRGQNFSVIFRGPWLTAIFALSIFISGEGSIALRSADQPKVGSEKVVRSSPLSPTESAAQLVISDGYQIQLIAAEPQVVSPVDAVFDDRGRMWVVEMIDYPFPPPTQTEPRGRIRILSDKDGDGRFESSTVFADRLDMPTGIGMWRDGAVVTLGGKFVWMRDVDGNDQVDSEEVWLEGFSQQNEQLRANHPRFESDGNWYIASGLRGGKVQLSEALRGNASGEPLDLATRDVRFNPKTRAVEVITGPAQFGLTTDVNGSRMFCTNRNPCVQVVLEQVHLTGNPLAGLVPPVNDVLPSGEASRVLPLVEAWTTSNLHAGQFTAACGVHFQQLTSTHQPWTETAANSTFAQPRAEVYTCEPTGSLVQMQRVSHDGSVWRAELDRNQAEQVKSEWLASRDPWFRPVNVLPAPGGGLLVIDMHRAVIEHPAWVPDELKKRPDERYGESAGRIYWASSRASNWPSSTLREIRERPLRDRTSSELVSLLERDDLWLRRTASRMLIEREDADVVPELERLVTTHSRLPEARVAGLQLLGLLNPALTLKLSDRVLADDNRMMQVAALRILARLERELGASHVDSIKTLANKALERAISTTDAWLRLEATLCVGTLSHLLDSDVRVTMADGLGLTAARQSNDSYLLVATAGACRENCGRAFAGWLQGLVALDSTNPLSKVGSDAARDKALIAASRLWTTCVVQKDRQSLPEIISVWSKILTARKQSTSEVSVLAALTGLTQHLRSLKAEDSTAQMVDLDSVLMKLHSLAQSSEAPLQLRTAAIELLGLSKTPSSLELLKSMAVQEGDGAIRQAGIRAWSEQGSQQSDEFLVTQLVNASPKLRPVLLDLLLGKPERQSRLLAALDDGSITARQLGAVELKRFVDRAKAEIKIGFQKQLDTILNSNRAEVLRGYQSCLDLTGDVVRGRQVFAKQCAACHRIGEIGVQVGPDISDSRVHTPDKLLTSVLDPNRAIDNNYFRFVVLTSDGKTFDGLIAEETADKIIIRSQNDQRHVIARSDIEQLKPTGVSMMPEGLESQIDHQAMSDLIAFIKNWRYDSTQIPTGIKAGK